MPSSWSGCGVAGRPGGQSLDDVIRGRERQPIVLESQSYLREPTGIDTNLIMSPSASTIQPTYHRI